jgi:hypothetical protein
MASQGDRIFQGTAIFGGEHRGISLTTGRCRRGMTFMIERLPRDHIILLPKLVFFLGSLQKEKAMEGTEYARKLEELDRLFNDPDAPVEPARLWRLLAELARYDREPPGAVKPAARH